MEIGKKEEGTEVVDQNINWRKWNKVVEWDMEGWRNSLIMEITLNWVDSNRMIEDILKVDNWIEETECRI